MDENWEPSEFAQNVRRWHEAKWWSEEAVREAYRKFRLNGLELGWILGTDTVTT